jgi:hypothetical protein
MGAHWAHIYIHSWGYSFEPMGLYASKPTGTKYVAVCTCSEYAEAGDEDVLEPFQVEYAPHDQPEVIVDAVYRKLNPSASSDEEARSMEGWHVLSAFATDTRTSLWCDAIAFSDPNAPPLAHYDLEQGTTVRVIVA